VLLEEIIEDTRGASNELFSSNNEERWE